MSGIRIIEQNRRKLEELCGCYRVERLSLFGSALRDDFDPEVSDLDFTVSFLAMNPVEHAAAYFGLLDSLKKLFGIEVDLVETSAIRNPYLRRSIEEEQEMMYVAA